MITDATTSHDTVALQLQAVSKSFGASRVLTGVDLQVSTGQVVSLLGPSGCGKTTLVRLVTGFEVPDSGTISLGGRPVAGPGISVPPESRRVGIVPQEGALFSHLDVAANIGFGLARGGRTRAGRDRVAHLLDIVGMAGLGGRRTDQLSGGQQQRVAVARALAPKPELVCLDEPFSALDAGLRDAVRDAVVAALRAEGATVVLVTHDQDEALSVSDTIAVMLDGRIAQVGAPQEVYNQPRTAAVAQFLGDAILLPGQARGTMLDCQLGAVPLAQPSHGPATGMLRPEQLAVHPDPHHCPTMAEVQSVDFHGHDALVRLTTAQGLGLLARLGPGWLPSPGDRVGIQVLGQCWVVAGS